MKIICLPWNIFPWKSLKIFRYVIATNLQEAINAAHKYGGGTVYLLRKTYFVREPLILSNGFIGFIGFKVFRLWGRR